MSKQPNIHDTPALATEALCVRLGGRWILREVDVELKAGRTLFLAGSNGAGKTTLLRVLSTLIPFQRGQVRLFGQSIKGAGKFQVRHLSATISHDHHYYSALSAYENLALSAHYMGIEPNQVDAALKRVGLYDARDRPFIGLSAGMKRRLSLARLELLDRQLWLLDEPFAQLDVKGVELVTEVIKKGQARGKTIVLTTHQHTLGEALCHQQLTLEQGKRVAV